MNYEEIRRQVIIAIAADDVLMEILTLKGGNALRLVHNIGSRASLDLDYAMCADIEDLASTKKQLTDALTNHFSTLGISVIGVGLQPKPKLAGKDPRWGGYLADFKLIRSLDLEKATPGQEWKVAIPINAKNSRRFTIDISKYDFADGEEIDFQGYLLRVYSPLMIAAGKFRALCQQLPGYPKRKHGTARARDFYDIYWIFETGDINLFSGEGKKVIEEIFRLKEVPLSLLNQLSGTFDFHEGDWPSVRDSIAPSEPQELRFYFDAVIAETERLKPLWQP